MSNRVWTQAKRVAMYLDLSSNVGPYVRGEWSAHKPNDMTMAEMSEYWVGAYGRLNKKCEGEGQNPKSPMSLAQQVAWALTTQNPNNLDANQRKLQAQNRQAAYEAGFITMTDILWLEAEAEAKANGSPR